MIGSLSDHPGVSIDEVVSELPEGWTTAQIGEYFESWGGATPTTSNPDYWGGEIPWISSKDVKQPRLRHGTDFATSRALQETRLRVCPPGTVLVVMRSGVLAHTLPVAITEADVVINQDIKAFASPEPQLNEWLALALRANEQAILHASRKDGTTVQSVQFPSCWHWRSPFRPWPNNDGSLEPPNPCSSSTMQ